MLHAPVRLSNLRRCSVSPSLQDLVLSTLQDWVGDPSSSSNATLLWVAGMVYSNEGKLAEALKACHTGLSLEL